MMRKESYLSKKTLMGLGLMMIGANTEVIRNLQQSKPNCNTYKADGSCDRCSFRYWKTSSGDCVQISDSCKTWSDSNGKCTSCYDGYGLNRSGTCTLGGGVSQTPVGVPSVDANCQCYNQNRSCNQCYDGYYLNSSGACVLLPENCTDVNQTYGKCVECEQGYFPDASGECKLVDTIPNDHCQDYEYVNSHTGQWKKAWFLNCQKACVKCQNGYYLDGDNKCQQLPDDCLEADVKGNCIECEAGFEPKQNGDCGIIIGTPVQNCAEYGYMNKFGKIFSKWFFKSKKVCIECKQGSYLDNTRKCQQLPKNCKQANTKGQCLKCEDLFELKDGQCKAISIGLPQNCAKADQKGACVKCDDGYELGKDNGECQKKVTLPPKCAKVNESGVCLKCDSGYKIDWDTGKCVQIVGLPPNCAKMSKDGLCTECKSGFKLEYSTNKCK